MDKSSAIKLLQKYDALLVVEAIEEIQKEAERKEKAKLKFGAEPNICGVCGYELGMFEHYVEHEGQAVCETCFLDMAVDALGAKSRQVGYDDEEEEE